MKRIEIDERLSHVVIAVGPCPRNPKRVATVSMLCNKEIGEHYLKAFNTVLRPDLPYAIVRPVKCRVTDGRLIITSDKLPELTIPKRKARQKRKPARVK